MKYWTIWARIIVQRDYMQRAYYFIEMPDFNLYRNTFPFDKSHMGTYVQIDWFCLVWE
jgi:hypothetical protein